MASLLAGNAAACGIPHFSQEAGAGVLASAVTIQGASAKAMRGIDVAAQASANATAQNSGAIVGLWLFKYTSMGNFDTLGIPDGAPIDVGLQMWHADGTEFTNSGGRPPVIGDNCLGVWAQKGYQPYRLTHWGLSWNADQTFLGPAIIHEFDIRLDNSGNSFSGNFTIDQYVSPAVAPPLLPDLSDLSILAAHISGVLTATRISVD
jgi:hypothetical protein